MSYFTTKKVLLFYDFSTEVEQVRKIDEFLQLLEESGVARYLADDPSTGTLGPSGYDRYSLFAAVIYGFSIGQSSLRNLEDSCRYDLRFKYIMNGETPSHVTFANLINDFILPKREEIFATITQQMFVSLGLSMDTVFIDGTKIEADANKYKFVWKPTTFHQKLDEKIRNLLSLMGLTRGIDKEGFVSSGTLSSIISKLESTTDTTEQKRIPSLVGYLGKVLEYEEKERICGPNRKSYYKTDHDATAMCLKDDYYAGLGSSMHAAYQQQIAVSNGFVCAYYVSQDRSDMYTFTSTMGFFTKNYGTMPSNAVADAGYGCELNYTFCKENGIRPFIKYQAWEGESSGRYPALYELEDDGTITCLGGRKGYECVPENRHKKSSSGTFFIVKDCGDCPYKAYCRRFSKDKESNERTFEVRKDYQRMKQHARDLLLSVEGIEMRVNRSCQVEGAFGVIKQDFGYTRSRRTSLEKVSTEFMLTVLGYNARKYMKYKMSGKKVVYWTAPNNISPQQFKKPSWKRILNRLNKKKIKSANEATKSSYKYK